MLIEVRGSQKSLLGQLAVCFSGGRSPAAGHAPTLRDLGHGDFGECGLVRGSELVLSVLNSSTLHPTISVERALSYATQTAENLSKSSFFLGTPLF